MFVRVITRREMRRRRMLRRFRGLAIVCALAILFACGIIKESSPAGLFSLSRGAVVSAEAAGRSSPGRAAADSDAVPPIGPYKLGPGPYAVAEVEDLLLHDDARDADLHVHIFYPQAGGSYPVIVFAQDAAASGPCCDALPRYWASYGYVTLQPSRRGSPEESHSSGGMQGRFLEASRHTPENPDMWDSRPEDISFLLDSLQEIPLLVPQFNEKMDSDRVGMSGHSLGAFTTEVIAGARVDLPGRPEGEGSSGASFADRRVRAALALSPLGPGRLGLTERSWDTVSLPYMGVTGSLETVGTTASPTWRKAPFELSQPGDKYQVVVRGADELSLVAERPARLGHAAKPQPVLDDVEWATLAFWDAYLKGDSAAKRYLASDALAKYTNGAVSVDRR